MDMISSADLAETTLDVAADQRQWRLEQLEKQTRQIAQLVREEHAKGEAVQSLAKRAKVTRATIYSWLRD